MMRRSERVRAGMAFATLLCVVGSYTIVKSVRDGVFLSRFSVTELSLVAVGVAVLSGSLVAIYLRATAGVARSRLVVASYAGVAATLVLLALGLRGASPPGWLPWVLYVWSSVFGLFVVLQFWLLASEQFDVREAKRVFGFVAGGAIFGGLAGGAVARALASSVSGFGLLLIAAALLLMASFVVHVLGWPARAEPGPAARAAEAGGPGRSSLLGQPRFVRQLALGLILASAVATLLDWQLKAVAKEAFAGHADELAGFFGSVYAYTSAGALLLQVLFTARLLKSYGVGAARMLLPLTLLLGFAALLGSAALPVSLLALLTAARLSEGSVRFAIHQPATELSWLVLPAHERSVGKTYVDTAGDRFGTALAGLLWVAATPLAFDRAQHVQALAVIGIALIAVWLLVLRATQRSYVAAMRAALAGRAVDLESLWQSLGQEQTRRTIVEAIESGDPARLTFSLYLLEGWTEELPDLRVALAHEQPAVRLQALRLLAEKSCAQQRAAALPCLSDPDSEVREAAIVYLRRTAPEGRDPLLAGLPEGDAHASLVRWLIERAEPDRESAARAAALAAIAAAPRPARVAMIHLLGAATPEAAAPLLAELLDDPDDEIVQAAIRAAGRARALALVPALAAKLARRRFRARAIGALSDLGAPALRELAPVLADPGAQVEVRRAIVRLASASRDPALAGTLAGLLDDPSRELAGEALRALARLRNHAQIELPRGEMKARILAEADVLVRDLLYLDKGAWPAVHGREQDQDFLRRSVCDAVDARVARIFRLLRLIHAPADVQSAYRGLSSPLRATRSRSIDFLDNLLDAEVKRVLLLALEDASAARFAAEVRRTLGLTAESREQAVARFRHGPDPWLRQVAAFSVSSERGSKMGMSVVEKALKLRTVDVLARVSSEELAYIADIAEEIELAKDTPIYAHGDAPDALYVVVSGTVRLHQDGEEIGLLGEGEAFGSWALFDEAPRVASAVAAGQVIALKVDREEFLELLGDRVELVRAIFKAMVERIRSLAELAQQR
jgi:ATP/ADP translocase